MQHRPSTHVSGLLAVAAFAALLVAAPAMADLDVVFVLDTTGSMTGEIREVQERVRELAASLARARPEQHIRYGIVAYRDRGDTYVTLHYDLTDDVSAAEEFLATLEAGGGGDAPESVLAAVAVALRQLSWSRSDEVERQIYLIGDAPPHLDYPDEPTPEELIAEARAARVVVNTIGCRSLSPRGVAFFRRLAYATEGSYQHIGRVTRESPGELIDTLSRAAAPPQPTTAGRELNAVWLAHENGEYPGILVRQGGPGEAGQSPDGAALAPCTLEIRLPPGYALLGAPRIWLGGERLRVELSLTEGPGGLELFSLPECPPAATPIDVGLGGD